MKKESSNEVVRLDNENCIYCNEPLTRETATKEHVIGRRFVPKGKLNGQWNLIVRACKQCNVHKSDLEDDISAITMQPDLAGDHGHEDQQGIQEAHRKNEAAISRRTKKAVKHSQESVTVKGTLGQGARVTVNFTGPAQIDEARVFELVRLQLTAFFYWITYSAEMKRGSYWPGDFHPCMVVPRGDWGNSLIQAFADAVVDWEPWVLGSTAHGFFNITVRKHPDADCWSWAIEWNYSTRVVGFFGSRAAAKATASSFPELEMRIASDGPDRSLRFRRETALGDKDDRLFFWEDSGKIG